MDLNDIARKNSELLRQQLGLRDSSDKTSEVHGLVEFSKEKAIGTAVHEAGHVAVALYLARDVEYATIAPVRTAEGVLRGRACIRSRPEGLGTRGFHLFEEDLIISFAGPIAEQMLSAGHVRTEDPPEDPYKSLVESVDGDKVRAEGRRRELLQMARDIMKTPAIHLAVPAIAQALLNEPDQQIPGEKLKAVHDAVVSGCLPPRGTQD